MTLQDQINAVYQKKVIKPLEDKTRKTGLAAYGNIARATPVKSGRARGNWNISVDTVNGSTTENTEAPNLLNAAASVASFVIGKVIYISNNLPYIKRLNDGYSKQAPANFVETGVALAKRQVGGK